MSYDLLIRHAEIINDREMANDALIDRSIEIEEAAEMVKHFDTEKLVKKCKKYEIFLSSIAVPEGKASIWRSDTVRSILYREPEEEIKKRLTAAKRDRNQARRENLKVLATVLGAVTGRYRSVNRRLNQPERSSRTPRKGAAFALIGPLPLRLRRFPRVLF